MIQYLWLIPVLPLAAAALSALARQRHRTWAAALAIGSMVISLALSLAAFAQTLGAVSSAAPSQWVHKFRWLQIGDTWLELGWVLDPLSAVMLVMVSFVGLLIFIYSVGYMAHDENFTRFFCFLSLFAAAMLGLVIANSLLLLFICWELVGLTSYLLIGFWYHKPSAAEAARKAFVTTRVGDVALLLGMVWLYAQSGTLLFYDGGSGCLEQSALTKLVAQTTALGMAASTGISLLIFCGAIGKSGQVPLHVWLPDAMEGPTPVSALIHAATMVAAGVFLMARVYPLLAVSPGGGEAGTAALQVVTWVGAITALFAASIAVAQTDIKRILAYSTVSQLGFMMMGLGAGGVAVAMFHLITHAFFKALLFLGAGSVIHGCHEEQDIRNMGGLRRFMPVTFAAYAAGMLALSGFPLLFSGFWSKDAILHAAHVWKPSSAPFYLGIVAAALTAFYMTRQMCYVFFGSRGSTHSERLPHESPRVMTLPLIVLAVFAVLLGFVGTPAWPWFQEFLGGQAAEAHPAHLFEREVLGLMLVSSLVVLGSLGLGWRLYGHRRPGTAEVLEVNWPNAFKVLREKYWVDEIYEQSVVRFTTWLAKACDWIDDRFWNGAIELAALAVTGLSWFNRLVDEYVVNLGFDAGCGQVRNGGGWMSRLQDGRVQRYLRMLGVGVVVLVLMLVWGCRAL